MSKNFSFSGMAITIYNLDPKKDLNIPIEVSPG